MLTEKINNQGQFQAKERYLVNSCKHNIGSLFIRRSIREQRLFINYIQSDHSGDTIHWIDVDFLYPQRGVLTHEAPFVYSRSKTN